MVNTEGGDFVGPTFQDNTHILDNYVCAGVKQIFNGIVTPNDSNANKNNIPVTYKIYDGNNTLLNTINTTTNNTGGHELQYTFPHKGNYNIIASVGDDTISLPVSVESLVDQITLSSSSNSVTSGNNVTLIAEVRSSTGDIVVGADVVFQISRSVGGSTSTDTVTTETSASGEARATYTYPGGTCHVKAIVSYGIDSNESSSITITESSALFDDITLTSDKSILSYNGGTNPDSATLTAQLTLNGANASVSGETVLFSAQKQGKTFTASNFSDIENIFTITDVNNKVHIESFDTQDMGIIVYDDIFGTYNHITRFTIQNFETDDVGYLCAVINNTPVNSFVELTDGDYELITHYQGDGISVYKDGNLVGNINLGIVGSTYQIGFYLSDARMDLVGFNDAEYLGSNVTDSSGKATVSYTSKHANLLNIKCLCSGLSDEIQIEDCDWYDDASSDKSSSYTRYESPTFNYNSNGYYYIRKSGSAWGFVTPMTTPITTNDDISIEVKFEYVGMFLGIGLYKSDTVHLPLTYYHSDNKIGMYGYGSTNNWIVAQESISASAPITMKFDLKDNVINLSVYDNNGALVWSKSNIAIPSTFNNSDLYLVIGNPNHNNTNNYAHFKNVKIKSL